jgi:predicted ATPase
MRGWALAEQGQGEAGLAQFREGIPAYCDTGGAWQPHLLGLLAETYAKVGQSEAGLRTVAQALARVDATEERSYEAELYRLRGELTLQVPGRNLELEAEAAFQKALKIARRQEAKSWELRAATSLARLWQQQGKRAEAHRMLSDVYNWFTEGFDTKDLQEAKALLDELA